MEIDQDHRPLVEAPDLLAFGGKCRTICDGIGVGQPIVFQFTYEVKNKAAVEKQLSVVSNPPQEGSWYWIDDKNVHYRPKVYWQPGTTLTVSNVAVTFLAGFTGTKYVYANTFDNGNDFFWPYQGSFTVGP